MVILAVGGGEDEEPYKPKVASAPDARAKSSGADDTLRHVKKYTPTVSSRRTSGFSRYAYLHTTFDDEHNQRGLS